MATTTSLGELFEKSRSSATSGIFTAIPAKVLRFDATRKTVDVEPMVRIPVVGEDDEVTAEDIPNIPNVPVLYPASSACFVSFPLAAGDFVLLVFSMLSTSEWRATGEKSTPLDNRRHGLGGAFAIPGAFADGGAVASGDDGGTVAIGKRGGERIAFPGAQIEIGAGAADFAALASKVDAGFAQITTYLTSHTHTSAAPASPTSPPIVPPTSVATVASTTIKIK